MPMIQSFIYTVKKSSHVSQSEDASAHRHHLLIYLNADLPDVFIFSHILRSQVYVRAWKSLLWAWHPFGPDSSWISDWNPGPCGFIRDWPVFFNNTTVHRPVLNELSSVIAPCMSMVLFQPRQGSEAPVLCLFICWQPWPMTTLRIHLII